MYIEAKYHLKSLWKFYHPLNIYLLALKYGYHTPLITIMSRVKLTKVHTVVSIFELKNGEK